MKTLGLIGGMTWFSTIEYYRIINQEVAKRLGALHSAKLVLRTVDFDEFKQLLDLDDRSGMVAMLSAAAADLDRAGAECVVLCANTPHMVAEEISARSRLPLIHIADASARRILAMSISTAGLLGTLPTMEGRFFVDRLTRSNIVTILPNEEDRRFIHRTVFEELGKGRFLQQTKVRYLGIINQLIESGAQAIILGCTEIPLLIKPTDCNVPLVDTVEAHAFAAVDFALE